MYVVGGEIFGYVIYEFGNYMRVLLVLLQTQRSSVMKSRRSYLLGTTKPLTGT